MALPSTLKVSAGTFNAATGGVLAAPLGTTLPTTAAGTIGAAFKPLGYVSEDGLEAQGERSVNAIKDWNGDIIAQLQTEHSVRFALTLYAAYDADTLAEVFGTGNVTITAPTVSTGTLIKVTETGAVLPTRAYIFDMLNDVRKLRIVLPVAKISEVSENAFVAGELMGFQVTVEAFKDATGVKAYRYYDDGVFSA
ncbi:phage tail tube protein [Nocardia sp. NPDC055049]